MPPKLNVQSFPRPPLLEKTPRHLLIKYQTHTVAETTEAYWVLEMHHPPTYYLPPTSLHPPFALRPSSTRQTYCEWKGRATYWDLVLPSTASHNPTTSTAPSSTTSFSTTAAPPSSPSHETPQTLASSKIWTYETPTPPFKNLKGYLSFYAEAPWECFVDGEEVEPQPGGFYGGWVTSDIGGLVKGGRGTEGW